MAERFTIVGLGEALFDVYPDRQVLGGAPLNVAVHAHALAREREGRAVVVSRVGQDERGRQIEEELRRRGMTSAYLQFDPDKPTGCVYVDVSDAQRPRYEIARDAAWDWLQFDPDVEGLARQCQAVCFGTLAQRESQSRNTIYRFLDAARQAVRMLDVNLREGYYDRRILVRSLEFANAVKGNVREMKVVGELLGLEVRGEDEAAAEGVAEQLMKRYGVRFVVVTRGAKGTVIVTPGGRFEGEVPMYPAAAGADSVGAGDACAAGVLVGVVLRMSWERVVNLANHMGAYVASQPGATPEIPENIRAMVRG